MNIDELRAVVDVSRFKSFAEAAEYESVSPSIISKYVSRIEEELGIKIFDRATKSKPVELTADGRAVIKDIRNMVNNYTSMVASVSTMKNEALPPLSIGFVPSLGHFSEDKLLSEFVYQNQTLPVRLIDGGIDKLLNCLMSNVADVLLVRLSEWDFEPGAGLIDKLFNPDLEMVELRRQRQLSLLVPEGNPLAKLKAITPDDLPQVRKNTLLLNSRSVYVVADRNKDRAFGMFGGQEGYSSVLIDMCKPFVVLDMMATHKEMIMPICVFDDINLPGFKLIPVKDWNVSTQLLMIFRKSNNSRTLRKFVDSLTEGTGR